MKDMLRLALVLLCACGPAPDEPQIWECTATASCNGSDSAYGPYSLCTTEAGARKEVETWYNVCQDALGIYGCCPWSCGATCEATGRSCKP